MNHQHFAAAAILLLPLSAMASPDAAPAQESINTPPNPHWTSPMVIDARPRPKGGFASLGQYFANYKGREMEMREILVGFGITEYIAVWASRQDYLVKGRSQTSRFNVDSDSYGVRWVFRPPTAEDARSWAVEFEAVRPDTATARTANAFASYNATKNNRIAVNYGLANGLQTQLGYTSVKGFAVGNANVINVGAGKDFTISRNWDMRLQGQIYQQSYTDALERVSFEVKAMLHAAFGYRLSDAARIELEGSFFPFGMPLSSGRFTGLSSFQIYRPGGVAEGLRSDAVGFGALRLVLSGRF